MFRVFGAGWSHAARPDTGVYGAGAAAAFRSAGLGVELVNDGPEIADSILWFESHDTVAWARCLRMCPEQTFRLRPAEAGGARRSARLAKSLLEPRVVAYGSEIVVPARLLAEGWVQLH